MGHGRRRTGSDKAKPGPGVQEKPAARKTLPVCETLPVCMTPEQCTSPSANTRSRSKANAMLAEELREERSETAERSAPATPLGSGLKGFAIASVTSMLGWGSTRDWESELSEVRRPVCRTYQS
jgi:hypothetical protein